MFDEEVIVPVKTEEEAATIWQALNTWSKSLKPWQRTIIALAVDHRRLTDVEIDTIYKEFLSKEPSEVADFVERGRHGACV